MTTRYTLNLRSKFAWIAVPFFVLFLSVGWQSASAQTPKFSFENGTTGTNSIPFGGGTWSDQRCQFYYAPGDFGATIPAGQAINVIYFRTGITAQAASTMSNIVIRMSQVNVSGLTATYETSGFITVLSKSSYVIPATGVDQWFPIQLDIPFAYDPSLPLIIETVQTATSGTKSLRSGGTPINSAYTGNTQTYGASSGTTGVTRRSSYAMGLDLISLAPINAGVSAITEPKAFCPGTHDVKATIGNFGTKQLDSVRVNWSVNNVFQGTIYHRTKLDTLSGTGASSASINLGSINFPAGVYKTIKVWTSYPNGQVDTVNSDDTLTSTVLPAMSGVFTIGGASADYATLTAAASALNVGGVCGPVEFHINAGTYTERLELGTIAGVSSTNTVSFIGASKTGTIITNNGSSTANWATIMLNGSDYVRFRNMTVRATNVTNGIGIFLTNKADYNQFDNMNIECNATATGTNVWGIVGSGSATTTTTGGDACNYTIIDSITFTGGYGGVSIYGTGSSTVHSYGNKVTNSSVTNTNSYGIRFYYQNDMELDRNKISGFRSTITYGLYVYYCSDYLVTNNDVISNYEALRLYYCDRYLMSGTFKSLTYNNLLKGGNYYSIYCYYSYDVNFYHNTVESNYTNGAYFYYVNNLDMRNNIMINRNVSATGYVMYLVNGSQKAIDHNVYFGSGSSFMYHDAAISDYAAWRSSFPLLNENSENFEPTFRSVNNLRLDQGVPFKRGDRTIGLVDDVDGDIRCEIAPTIGADENFFLNPSPSAGIAREDTIYVSSPTTFYSAYQPLAGVLWDYTWYVDDVLKGTELDFRHAFPTTGTYEVKLRARSCSGSDRDSIMVNVVTPTSAPLTDFTASKLAVDVLEESFLSDLSDFGATQWEWTADPSSDAVFSNAYESNPSVIFLAPGEYQICLTTANGSGLGNKVCKSAYINVNDDQMMCSGTESELPAGRITDEGGVLNNYTANSSCNFLIRPCAGAVNLRFTQWVLSDVDDVLSVYDGTNNSAPLIGKYNGTSNIPGGLAGLVANSGKMYLEWRTSTGGQAAGFTAYWTSTPDANAVIPTADFSVADSVFVNQTVLFTSTSTGASLSYRWDFDAPNGIVGLDGGKQSSDRYAWTSIGSFPVSLTVKNCGGSNVKNKTIQVITPTTAPVVRFSADRVKVPVLSTVTFTDESYQGPTSWKWTITPSVTANMLTPNNQGTMQVSFIKSGKYTIQLKVSNSIGEDSLVKVDYIDVFDYCAPVVGNTSSDIGISRVKFAGIDNYSGTGVKYSSYLNNFAAQKVALRDSIEIRIERSTLTDPLNRKVWVDWNNDGDFDDAGEEVASQGSNRNSSFTAKFVVPANASLVYTTLRVGVSYDQDVNRPCGINPTGEFEDYPLQVVVDNTAPVITLLGQPIVTLEQGHQYTDAGATALDNVDGNLTPILVITNTVDTSVAGNYVVRYNVTDMDGNVATQVVRTVIVTPDVTAPIISMNGSPSVSVTVGTSYTDAGATASDYFQVDLSAQMQQADNIDLNMLGTYYVWYTVEDASGNKDSVVREVNVIDDIAPVLSLVGANPMTIEVKSSINDPGYTVSDNYYTTVNVEVDSSLVNKQMIGVYPMTYTATDGSGNRMMLTRMVSVEDHTAPTLVLIGSDTVEVDVFSSYNEQGVQVQDNYCTNLNWSVDMMPNTKVLGDYTLSYSSEDCNGNTSLILTRVVRVIDREAPELTLNGFAANTVYRWAGYTDPGVSIDDNYYSEASLQANVAITSNFDPNWVGFYNICYQVTDPSGNKSRMTCRSIEVAESLTGLQTDTEKMNLIVYPNPSTGKFILKLESANQESRQLNLVDMLGKTVYSQSIGAVDNYALDLSILPAGMYILNVSGASGTANVKIQILH